MPNRPGTPPERGDEPRFGLRGERSEGRVSGGRCKCYFPGSFYYVPGRPDHAPGVFFAVPRRNETFPADIESRRQYIVPARQTTIISVNVPADFLPAG